MFDYNHWTETRGSDEGTIENATTAELPVLKGPLCNETALFNLNVQEVWSVRRVIFIKVDILSLSLFLALFLLSYSLPLPHDLYSLFLCLWMVQPFIPLPGALLDARSTRERDSAKRREGAYFFSFTILSSLWKSGCVWLATCVRDEWWFAPLIEGKRNYGTSTM